MKIGGKSSLGRGRPTVAESSFGFDFLSENERGSVRPSGANVFAREGSIVCRARSFRSSVDPGRVRRSFCIHALDRRWNLLD